MTLRAASAALAMALLAGCAGQAPVESRLDSKGRTQSRATALLTLARAAPRYSEAARDYVYLAPVEVNETGTRRHYLWLGLATTIDRVWLAANPATAETLIVSFDGVPVALPLSRWEGEQPQLETPAPTYDVRRAQVTLDQLERLATAAAIGVEIVTADGTRASFELWRGRWTDWLPYVAGIEPPTRRAAR